MLVGGRRMQAHRHTGARRHTGTQAHTGTSFPGGTLAGYHSHGCWLQHSQKHCPWHEVGCASHTLTLMSTSHHPTQHSRVATHSSPYCLPSPPSLTPAALTLSLTNRRTCTAPQRGPCTAWADISAGSTCWHGTTRPTAGSGGTLIGGHGGTGGTLLGAW